MSQTLRNIGDITYIIDNVYFFIGKLLINKSSSISTLRVDFFSHNLLSIKVKFKILQLQNFKFFRYAKLFIPRKSVWCKKKNHDLPVLLYDKCTRNIDQFLFFFIQDDICRFKTRINFGVLNASCNIDIALQVYMRFCNP